MGEHSVSGHSVSEQAVDAAALAARWTAAGGLIEHAAPRDVAFPTVYGILRLRVDVFVVEQQCPYPELDGRDLEPGAEWWWASTADGRIAASIRTLPEPDGSLTIGRVVAAGWARGTMAATAVFAAVVAAHPDVDLVLGAQLVAHRWYERFGFAVNGPMYVEDGIPHLPMRLAAGE
jgi:ElaA protein